MVVIWRVSEPLRDDLEVGGAASSHEACAPRRSWKRRFGRGPGPVLFDRICAENGVRHLGRREVTPQCQKGPGWWAGALPSVIGSDQPSRAFLNSAATSSVIQ